MQEVLKKEKEHSFKIFDTIAGTYDLLNRILSFGIDILWRKKLIRQLPPQRNLKVLDLATGTGDLAIALANDKRVSHVTGIDLSCQMIRLGRKKIQELDIQDKVILEIGDAVSIPKVDSSFDAVTVSFGIRNFPDTFKSLENSYRVLKPKGRCLVLEFGLPANPFLRVPYLFYFRSVLPLIGGLLSGNWKAYRYLNQTVEQYPYGIEFKSLMERAGFQNVKAESLSGGIAYLYSGDKC
jgi:demethylmenaquinone methyltransferase/2-methoxy-6-polyprenyl-1,4-benzoquinol methylase